jgi:hypothetical protein
VGVKEGYLGFIAGDPGYTSHVPEDIRNKFDSFFAGVKAGKIPYELPPL